MANNRLSRHNGVLYLEFRCAVMERDGACPFRHLEPVANMQEANDIKDCGFLCEECQKKGYAWYTRLLGNLDEDKSLIHSLAQDGLGDKNEEFREGDTTVTDGQTHKLGDITLGNATIASGFEVGKKQKKKGEKGSNALKGYSVVRQCPEVGDVLMLRNSEATDPAAPFVERKQRTVFGMATEPKSDNPFDEMFDD